MLVLTLAFFIAEITVGYMCHSLALVADSFHMLSDAFALVIGLVSVRLSKKDASNQFTFGWVRAEVRPRARAQTPLPAHPHPTHPPRQRASRKMVLVPPGTTKYSSRVSVPVLLFVFFVCLFLPPSQPSPVSAPVLYADARCGVPLHRGAKITAPAALVLTNEPKQTKKQQQPKKTNKKRWSVL